jgi:hypothetical protein
MLGMDRSRGSCKAVERFLLAIHGTLGIGFWALALVPQWDLTNTLCLIGFAIAAAYCWQEAFRAYRNRGVNPPVPNADGKSGSD